ncbi:MAG: hypothetical protein KDA61_10900 [Planctomycetales bacterium]|nr:hypothetical protein [Planctomycetales bacterium]
MAASLFPAHFEPAATGAANEPITCAGGFHFGSGELDSTLVVPSYDEAACAIDSGADAKATSTTRPILFAAISLFALPSD